MSESFPFTAIVGQEPMKLALLLTAVNPRIGGVLIRGERGTAKTTAARGLAALLPDITVVEGCSFLCDPDDESGWCEDCRRRGRESGLRRATRPAPFVDLPISASEDRVVGSIDLEAAIKSGSRRFHPGLLAAANRGVLYVDEVNLLDDHLVDVLLDAAASGTNVVEREGITLRHASRFVLVGTMNPEEGELRPQLLDRFGLCVDVIGTIDITERVDILDRCLAFDRDGDAMAAQWAAATRDLSVRVSAARRAVDGVRFTDGDLRSIAALAAGFNLAGHRSELVILRAACAAAALAGRQSITDADILLVAPLALRHRLAPEAGLEDTARVVPTAVDLEARLESARASAAAGPDAPVTEKKTSRAGR